MEWNLALRTAFGQANGEAGKLQYQDTSLSEILTALSPKRLSDFCPGTVPLRLRRVLETCLRKGYDLDDEREEITVRDWRKRRWKAGSKVSGRALIGMSGRHWGRSSVAAVHGMSE